MPRFRPIPPPDIEALEALPLHVLVRDWPELLWVLKRAGVDVAREGALSLSRLPPAAPRPSTAELLSATRWRELPRRG